jgi:predicted MPP superfamily phosphohydrolase
VWLGPPFFDEHGHKSRLFERFSRAQPHVVRKPSLRLEGWPALPRPLRVAFLSDFHTGSHAGDVARLRAIVAQAASLRPDLVLLGGDYVNMQPFGGGRVSPRVVASILAGLDGPCGRFAVLGNHDIVYDAREVGDALREARIDVLDDERRTIRFEGHALHIVGIPDARVMRPSAHALLASLGEQPTIVLAHDPVWFAHVPRGPHLTLAGHTHGGQIRLPGIGALVTASHAPRRWAYGLVKEGGRLLYVTSGIGTSALPIRIGAPPEIVLLEIGG